MCRLLAYASQTPRAVADLLGPGEYKGFRELSHLHRDGWGMGWLSAPDDDGLLEPSRRRESGLQTQRSTIAAYEDPAFDSLAGRRLAAAGFVHLRWATSGLAIAEANTHPFLADGWAFAHQGSIPSAERIDSLLSSEWSDRRRGTTDSERYFLYFLQCLDGGDDVVEAMRRAVSDVVAACGTASLNAVALSSSCLLVVHGRSGLEPPRHDLLEAMGRPEDVPPDHLEGYFGLHYRQSAEEILIISSGLTGAGWRDVPEDSIVHIDLSTRAASGYRFDGSPATPLQSDVVGEGA